MKRFVGSPFSAAPSPAFDCDRAWEQALEQHYAALCDFAVSMLGSADVAADLVHDLFLHLWRTRRLGDASRFGRPYLFVATRNRALKYLRHQRVAQGWIERTLLEEPVSPETPDARCERQDLERAVDQAIAELPPRCREIFLLRRREELSYSEIAERAGISLNTVKSQIWRAALLLREKLREHLD
ncbi:MAG TPA: RNA polymerase sigma-70 factor [Gemmatimonadaceae bacterium]|nr:RNA polymerase sigma-70 factor [Gemmatimonadaceae bacterium]